MIKIMRHSEHLEMGAMVGIDPKSDGLARAAAHGRGDHAHEGIDGLLKLPVFKDIDIVFDATSRRRAQAPQRSAAGRTACR